MENCGIDLNLFVYLLIPEGNNGYFLGDGQVELLPADRNLAMYVRLEGTVPWMLVLMPLEGPVQTTVACPGLSHG